jgi:threonylcarbamoyladenosine tRNA methylthiotransferase MtaB
MGIETAGKGYNDRMKRVAITTLGCKTNQFESAAMSEKFEKSGYNMVPFSAEADIYIINSCTVTARTDAETRRLIRRARRLNPAARIVATGCYAQVAPEELERLPEVDSVLGNHEKQDIIALVESGESRISNIAADRETGPLKLESFAEHTRAFLQAQNGCNSFCAYCIVPYARGRSRSVPLEDVLQGVRDLADNGYQEIVLTGIHLGAYGLDLTPAVTLTDLVRRIDSERLVPRLRIGSVEPNEVTDELLELMASSEIICPHLHLPLQSGSDSVLKRMGRRYTADFFRNLVTRISASIPNVFIGADVIAGFPGESDAEFNETLQLIKDLSFSDLHVFPYSSRPGTKAADMSDQVPGSVIKKRAELLRDCATLKKAEFLAKQAGIKLQVLIQGYDANTLMRKGISRNYITVHFPGQTGTINTEQTVTVTAVAGEHVIGQTDHD